MDRGVVAAARPLAFALLVVLTPVAGCMGDTGEPEGVIVTSQPLVDAFHELDRADQLAGVPDWAIVDEPPAADRVGRPFVIEAEEVVRREPALVLDQPHPLVTGPSREAMATGVQQAGVGYEKLPSEPALGTVEATLAAAGDATGTDHTDAWQQTRSDLADLNETLADQPRPSALFLFPAGLVAGTDTDVDLILELAGMENAAREAGLTGYAQITDEAVQRTDVDLVIATATMHTTPEEIAGRPMFADTAIEDSPERVLVVDPSRTTRLGPHVAEAASQLAAWSHEEMPGPRLSPTLDPYEVHACEPVDVDVDAPNATVTLLGETHDPGTVTVPDVAEGHYRLTVEARDDTGTATTTTMLTVEGSDCD
jgi:ABC-type hemin transport system substrate-binding protein